MGDWQILFSQRQIFGSNNSVDSENYAHSYSAETYTTVNLKYTSLLKNKHLPMNRCLLLTADVYIKLCPYFPVPPKLGRAENYTKTPCIYKYQTHYHIQWHLIIIPISSVRKELCN